MDIEVFEQLETIAKSDSNEERVLLKQFQKKDSYKELGIINQKIIEMEKDEKEISDKDNKIDNELNRLVKSDDCYDSKYLSNIQNVKRDHFSKLIYVMLFEDCIKIFESVTEDISNIPNWSGKHGRYDAVGKSGQFGITKATIKWHFENNLVATLTWDEVYEISKGIIG